MLLATLPREVATVEERAVFIEHLNAAVPAIWR